MTSASRTSKLRSNGTTGSHPVRWWALIIAGLTLITTSVPTCSAQAMLGEIYLVPYTFSPVGFAECNGQLLLISQNTALFALLGTTYGGDGRTTFALPDLRDRVPVGAGQGPGLSDYTQGQRGGESTHTLTIGEMPSHTHGLGADPGYGGSAGPGGMVFATCFPGIPVFGGSPNATAAENAIGSTGGGAPHNNLQPYLGLKYIIALQGTFPSRP
jgi:microcystin-dependent protein